LSVKEEKLRGMGEKVLLSWSGGKDSALSLFEARKDNKFNVSGLLTVVTEEYERVSMHGIRRALLRQQADSIGLPLIEVFIPKDANMESYEKNLEEVLLREREKGVSSVLFGDLFLEDIRDYRLENMKKIEMVAKFPIWGRDTRKLANLFIQDGFKARIACVDTEVLDASFSGRLFDQHFLEDLPEGIDPCGENGEFHTFTYDGPIFKSPISFEVGRKILSGERFNFCEFIEMDGDGEIL
jgi:uncharacterized protein (TIGR00290 family)